jgi:hypothetical protein
LSGFHVAREAVFEGRVFGHRDYQIVPGMEPTRRPVVFDAVVRGACNSKWRNYEPWLGSLEDALGDALIRYRD